MNHVCGVEKLRNSRVDILLSLCLGVRAVCELGVVSEVEHHILADIRAIVVDVRVLALPVLLREDLNRTTRLNLGKHTVNETKDRHCYPR